MNLKHVLGQIEANGSDRRQIGDRLSHGRRSFKRLLQRQPFSHGSSLSQMPRGRRPHHQTKIYTAIWRAAARWVRTVFAHKSSTRSVRFDAENGLYSVALTMPLDGRRVKGRPSRLVSGSRYRRARGREDRAQPAPLLGPGMTVRGPRWRDAQATGLLMPGAQAPPR